MENTKWNGKKLRLKSIIANVYSWGVPPPQELGVYLHPKNSWGVGGSTKVCRSLLNEHIHVSLMVAEIV